MKKILLALTLFIFSTFAVANETSDTASRLENLSEKQISQDGTSQSIQAALGCQMAQHSRSLSNLAHGVSTPAYDCEESKVKENGADMQAISIYSFFEVVSFIVIGVITASLILVIFELTSDQKKIGKNQFTATICVILVTVFLVFPYISIKTSSGIVYKTSPAAVAMVASIQYASDDAITSISNMLSRLHFKFPAVKMPIKSGNTDDFESFMDYTIKSLSRNKQPVTFNYYLEDDKIVGYSYTRNLKATMSISLDEKAIAIAKKNGFKDMQAYQVAEIQKALNKSMTYATTTAVIAANAYNESGTFDNKTFDIKELQSADLKCDQYLHISDLDNYDQDAIIGAYRKLASACASTILADEISSYRGITTNAALQSNYLKNGYIAYCAGDSDFQSPKFTFKDAKAKAKACADEACGSSAFMCSVGLNTYASFDQGLENIIESNNVDKIVNMFFMGASRSDLQDSANLFLNTFNFSYEEIEDENVVSTTATPLFSITLQGSIDLNGDDWDTALGWLSTLWTEVVGFDVSLPSFDDIADYFNFGDSGRFGLTEAATCLKYQNQVKDGYLCGNVYSTQRKFFVGLLSHGIDGKIVKTIIGSSNKGVKNNLNAEIKQQATDIASKVGTFGTVITYLVASSSDKNLYGDYTKDMTLKSQESLVFLGMFLTSPQVLDYMDRYFTFEMFLGFSGYYLMPFFVLTYFFHQQILFWVNFLPNILLHSVQALRRVFFGADNNETMGLPDFLKPAFIGVCYFISLPLAFGSAYVLLGAFFAEFPQIDTMAASFIYFEPTSIISTWVYDIAVALFSVFLMFMVTAIALSPIYLTTIITTWIIFKTSGYFEQEEDMHKDMKEYWSK